jgi:hypothetical protein
MKVLLALCAVLCGWDVHFLIFIGMFIFLFLLGCSFSYFYWDVHFLIFIGMFIFLFLLGCSLSYFYWDVHFLIFIGMFTFLFLLGCSFSYFYWDVHFLIFIGMFIFLFLLCCPLIGCRYRIRDVFLIQTSYDITSRFHFIMTSYVFRQSYSVIQKEVHTLKNLFYKNC